MGKVADLGWKLLLASDFDISFSLCGEVWWPLIELTPQGAHALGSIFYSNSQSGHVIFSG